MPPFLLFVLVNEDACFKIYEYVANAKAFGMKAEKRFYTAPSLRLYLELFCFGGKLSLKNVNVKFNSDFEGAHMCVSQHELWLEVRVLRDNGRTKVNECSVSTADSC